MADESRKKSQAPDLETIFNSDIGDDWGEAFEAEDFMASPQEDASLEFFLPEEPPAETATTGIKAHVNEAPSASASTHPRRLSRLKGELTSRFTTLPLPLRIASVTVPILIALALSLFLHKAPTPPTTTKTEIIPTETTPVEHTETPSPQPPPVTPQHQTESSSSLPKQTTTAPPKPQDKGIRKKWAFPAILVQAKSDKNQGITILSTDLTLTLTLHPEILLPSEKESFIREMIYQFYANQPASDLRRFAMERGEMTHKLQAWITKQWPGLPLDFITVDRYQLL